MLHLKNWSFLYATREESPYSGKNAASQRTRIAGALLLPRGSGSCPFRGLERGRADPSVLACLRRHGQQRSGREASGAQAGRPRAKRQLGVLFVDPLGTGATAAKRRCDEASGAQAGRPRAQRQLRLLLVDRSADSCRTSSSTCVS